MTLRDLLSKLIDRVRPNQMDEEVMVTVGIYDGDDQGRMTRFRRVPISHLRMTGRKEVEIVVSGTDLNVALIHWEK